MRNTPAEQGHVDKRTVLVSDVVAYINDRSAIERTMRDKTTSHVARQYHQGRMDELGILAMWVTHAAERVQ